MPPAAGPYTVIKKSDFFIVLKIADRNDCKVFFIC